MALKIGELAKRAGLTVRALHHYDAIGLLSPSARSDGGSRQYSHDDVIRLHRIQALKHLGCSLSDIKTYLDDSGMEPVEIIHRQISVLDEQARRALALRDGLQHLAGKIASGGETATADWLNLLEMMTMYEKHLTREDLDHLRAQQQQSGAHLDARRIELIAETRSAIDTGLLPENQEAQALAWRWIQHMKDATGDNARLASGLKSMQEREPRAQEIIGFTPDMHQWISLSIVHARARLFAKYLTPVEFEEVRRRMIARADDWPLLFAEVRAQMDAGADVTDPDVQALARRWQALFRDSYCGDDVALESKIHLALRTEPDLSVGVGLDMPLILFIQKAILALNGSGHQSINAGPKPSAQRVATLRAAHQLLDDPLILEDRLALKILGGANEAAVRSNPDHYDDPLSKGLRMSVVVRSRYAEYEWRKAARNDVRQYVILGAGLDTYAYRENHQARRIFEVDLPATQQWKRECLSAADIEIPASLTYVPMDFEHDTLARALSEAGFRKDEPAFFSWLGVSVYLEEEAILETLRFIASCAAGSAVVFDYVVTPSLLTPMEQLGMELVRAKVSESGEAWKSCFDPASLADKILSLGFSEANNVSPESLNDIYLTGRKDGFRMGGSSRLMHAVV
ncbi:SAM-dependent methyltransferase [Burkholderia ubonensis]|uniref:SAM-dependent methyltransferase n=1 Tax=Burkholderia ubonensis TaxID=101571 RepID=UPI002AB5A816|nr:SAM-dependent methyltransferase [Burkholderia ubonensis]MDY7788621.1 SAM-dependent methyltransferase [Burkholderia ubonensis]